MADTAAPRTPSRTLGMVLLLIVTLGSLYFFVMGLWELLKGDRITGIGWFSLGLAWFLFFSWVLRVVQRPRPVS